MRILYICLIILHTSWAFLSLSLRRATRTWKSGGAGGGGSIRTPSYCNNTFVLFGRSSIEESFAEYQELLRGQSVDDIQKILVRKGLDFENKIENGQPGEKVRGCVASVFVHCSVLASEGKNDTKVALQGTSDAIVSRGLLAVLISVLQGQSSQEVLKIHPSEVADLLGIRKALSTGRNDGLANMMQTIQNQILREKLPVSDENPLRTATSRSESRRSVALLLSGGVDSSVALHLLLQQDYDVTAFYLKIWLEDELAHLGQCPWEDDYRTCEEVCRQAGVPLEAISLQQQYHDRVIHHTIHEASHGRTPNPDILCNSRVKFGCFYDAIVDRDFDFVATGHYARLESDPASGLMRLYRAPDPVKDQSYFLCALKQEQLQKVKFPLGGLLKTQVRELAEQFDLPNKNRPDSQGLCFLGKVKFEDFLGVYLGSRPGPIIDASSGDQLGVHNGIWYHTVGQRKGIGKVLDPKATARGPWYVVAKDPSRDIIFCSNQYDEKTFTAARSQVTVEDIQWVTGSPPSNLADGPGRFTMKIRHGPKLAHGSLDISNTDCTTGDVTLDEKDGGLAPGQYIVFYDDEECLGGGIISETHWGKFIELTKEHNDTQTQGV